MNSNKKGRNSKTQEFRFRAGRMFIEGGKVKPDPTKGEIRIYISLDGLLSFQWVDSSNTKTDEPIVIFSDEWDWVKIGSQKGRVYLLQNKTFEDDKNFFWLQDPDTSKDQEINDKMKQIVETGAFPVPISANTGSSNTNNNLSNKETTNASTNTANNNKMMEDLSSALKTLEKRIFKLIYYYFY